MDSDNQAFDGFTKVVNRRTGHKKSTTNTKTNQVNMSKPSTRNGFAALTSNDVQDFYNVPQNEKETSKDQPSGTAL